MRRSVKIAVTLALLAVVLMLLGWWYDTAPKGRAVVRGTLPGMTTNPNGSVDAADLPSVERSDDLATVICRVEGDGEPGALTATLDEDLQTSTTAGNDLILRVEPGRWRLAWEVTVTGGETTRSFTQPLGTWDLVAGDTRACVLGPTGVPVRGRVVDKAGTGVPGALIEGCESRLTAGEDGTFAGPIALSPSGRCELRARFLDGALSRYGPPVAVDLFTATQPVELSVPTDPVAGLGIGFQVDEGGVRVTMVMPDSPAYAAGLEVGDLIIGVDGTTVIGLDTWQFLALGTGREGSLVRLDVRYEDVVDHIEFRRERIAALETP